MTRSALPGTLIVTCSMLAGCDRPTPTTGAPSSSARIDVATPAPVRPAPESDSIRATLRAAGFEAPPIEVVIDGPARRCVGFKVPGKDAVSTWMSVRAVTDQIGAYPVIMRGEDLKLMNWIAGEQLPNPDELLQQAVGVDVAVWIEGRHADRAAAFEDGAWYPPRDESAKGAQLENFTIPMTLLQRSYLPHVWLVLVPTVVPWQVYAYLGLGGQNDYPEPQINIALHKHWYEKYGAEIVGVSGDVMEMRVTHRPTTESEAFELAMEQYASCEDIVDQGVNTVDALAKTLLVSDIWFFWWD